MAHLAHFIFNAVNGVSTAMELAEYRGFKSMVSWRAILANNGFENAPIGADVPLIRQGDPTKNRMVCLKLNPSFQLEDALGTMSTTKIIRLATTTTNTAESKHTEPCYEPMEPVHYSGHLVNLSSKNVTALLNQPETLDGFIEEYKL